MTVPLRLTDEQAEWLKELLDSMLDDAHWQRGRLHKDEDAQEHAQTIHDKIEKELKDKKWS